MAGINPEVIEPPMNMLGTGVVNLATGEVIPRLTALHGPIRDTPASPEKAARKAARKAATATRAALAIAPLVPEAAPGKATEAPAKAPRKAPASDSLAPPRADWHRTNRTVPLMVEAMREAPRTLAELQTIGLWGAPVELRHLRKIEAMRGVKIVAAEGDGAEVKYCIAA